MVLVSRTRPGHEVPYYLEVHNDPAHVDPSKEVHDVADDLGKETWRLDLFEILFALLHGLEVESLELKLELILTLLDLLCG